MFSRNFGWVALAALTLGIGFWFGRGQVTSPSQDAEPRLHLGDIAPDFEARTTQGTIRFHEWMGEHWTILLSHPRAFTPVCSTELGVAAIFQKQFAERNTKLIALSIDTIASQNQWVSDINAMQNTPIEFPLIADTDRRIARLYGMLDTLSKDDLTVRSVFIIDPQKRIRLKMDYPASTGRNFAEILRALEALQVNSERSLATPANWEKGQKLVIPADVPTEEAQRKYAKGFEEMTSYLRLTAY
jgi:alkyl hydroperoxide reductase subunit AhpC